MVKKESGQVILALILIMTVALAIGLSIVQKSLVDVSTASKVEQSSRAFSAAEAGIEKALQAGTCGDNCVSFSENSSKADVSDMGLNPSIPVVGNRQVALEYPPLAKEDAAQVWLADYKSADNPPPAAYTQPTLDIYWGNFSATDKAALEITLVYYDGSIYKSSKWYLDNPSAIRNPANGFDNTTPTCGVSGYPVGANTYQCKKTLSGLPSTSPNILMLIRVRLLYNSTSQPFAVQATGICGTPCSLPPQARSITSTGISGETQRKVNLFQLNKVVPPYFDYAIFSAGPIVKTSP